MAGPSGQLLVRKNATYTGSRNPVYTLGNAAEAHCFYAAGGGGTLLHWNMETGTAASFAKLGSSCYTVCFIPSAQQLAIGESTGNISFTGDLRPLDLHRSPIFSMYCDDSSHRFFAGDASGMVSVWDTRSWEPLKTIRPGNDKLRSIAADPSRQFIAIACTDGTISVLDYSTLEILRTFSAQEAATNVVCWHPALPLLLSGSKDARLRIWDTGTDFMLLDSIPAHNYAIYSIVFNGDGSLFATASRDKTIKLWNGPDAAFLHRIDEESGGHVNSVNQLLWHQHHQRLLSASDDHSVMAWDIQRQKL